MRFSFLLPAYKAKFLRKTLDSIINQSFRDFNVVISDDCSPENLKSIVDSYKDSRIEYHRSDKNIGAENLTDHWNKLLTMTDADYCIMASDDDIYDTEFLMVINSIINNYPEAKVYKPRRCYINDDGIMLEEEPFINKDILTRAEFITAFAHRTILSGVSHYVFKRNALVSAGGFVKFPYAWYSDDATVFMMSDKGIGITDALLFSMRKSSISISSGRQSLGMVKGKIRASEMYLSYISKFELADSTFILLSERARRVTNTDLKRLHTTSFIAALHYAGVVSSDIYPLKWRIRKGIGYLVHNILKIK